MPIISTESTETHKELKLQSIRLDSTMTHLAEQYIKVGLAWGLHDEVLVEAIQAAAKKKGKSVGEFLLDCASS